MSAKILPFKARLGPPDDQCFESIGDSSIYANGGCPICKSPVPILNVYKAHWSFCDQHKVCWKVGEDLFGGWIFEDESVWRRNAEKLNGYRIVEPYYPDEPPTKKAST